MGEGLDIYRPHTKYGEGNVFTGICLLTGVLCRVCVYRGMGRWGQGVCRGDGGVADPPPRPKMGTAAIGTHPTEIHSCLVLNLCAHLLE